MLYLPPTECQDGYSDAVTLGPVFSATHANVQVGASISDTAAALYQVAVGKPGDWRWTLEREFTAIPQTFRIGRGVIGLRFRNAIPGDVATVQVYLLGPRDPEVEPGTPFGNTLVPMPTQTILSVAESGVYLTPAACRGLLIDGVGAGGGGGGAAATGAGQAAASSGGGGGAFARVLIVNPTDSYAYTVGAAGVAGAVGADGGAGNDTIFGAVLRAKGGSGGGGSPATATAPNQWTLGGAGGVTALSTGDLLVAGSDGGNGVVLSTAIPTANIGGQGGAAGSYSASTRQSRSDSASAAKAYGGGGVGVASGAGTPGKIGGAGFGGLLVVTELY